MPRRDWLLRVEDMLEAAEKIERYTRGMHLEAFASAEMAADAVIRNVQIIGEAARHIPNEVQAQYPNVDWAGMYGMCNVLVHDYPGVDLEIVWKTIKEDLPPTVVAPSLPIVCETPENSCSTSGLTQPNSLDGDQCAVRRISLRAAEARSRQTRLPTM